MYNGDCSGPQTAVLCIGQVKRPPHDRQHVQVFVQWSMTGTFEGEIGQSSGVSLMSFDDEGRIAETQVYRQALPAEVTLAQRSKRVEPVEQGVLLERSSQ